MAAKRLPTEVLRLRKILQHRPAAMFVALDWWLLLHQPAQWSRLDQATMARELQALSGAPQAMVGLSLRVMMLRLLMDPVLV
jgi:hypothetical protein